MAVKCHTFEISDAMFDVDQVAGGGGGADHYSAPQGGGISPLLLARKIKIYSIFYCHFSSNRPFQAPEFKTLEIFSAGDGPPDPHPFWTPLSNIPGGNPDVCKGHPLLVPTRSKK